MGAVGATFKEKSLNLTVAFENQIIRIFLVFYFLYYNIFVLLCKTKLEINYLS